MASPFFKDLLSLPQPPDGESIDGLPVIQLSEDSDVLSTLVSMLYPLHPVIPKSYEKVLYLLAIFSEMVPYPCYKVLYLLAACQKYEMDALQSSIRAKVSHGEYPAPKGAEVFSAYGIASRKGLIPEMEKAARQTLYHPMTFEILGESMRLFEGWMLRDLIDFRINYRDFLHGCYESFVFNEDSQLNIWSYCENNNNNPGFPSGISGANGFIPSWVVELYNKHGTPQEVFSRPLINPQSIRGEYLSALQAHMTSYGCAPCAIVHIAKGEAFCNYLEDRLTQTLNEVCPCSFSWSCGSKTYTSLRRERYRSKIGKRLVPVSES